MPIASATSSVSPSSPSREPLPPDLSQTLGSPPSKKLYTPARSAFQPFDLDGYLLKANLCPEAERFIREAMAEPSRGPNGYVSNTVRYPSHRLAHTLTAESRRFEFPFALIATQRPDALAVVEQPSTRRMTGRSKDGTVFSFEYTADFLVLTPTGVEIHEVKPVTQLAALCLKNSNRYQQVKGKRGVYDSAPVREYFDRLGFKFTIETERNLDGAFAANAVFLHPYVTGTAREPISQAEYDLFIGHVRANPGSRLREIPMEPKQRRAELVFHFLGKTEVFTHLSEADLKHPETIRLYPTVRDESAFLKFRKGTRLPAADLKQLGYLIAAGSLIEIQGQEYKVTRFSEDRELLTLTSDDGVAREYSFQQLLDVQPKIGGIYDAEMTFEALFRSACDEDRAVYSRNKTAITPYLPGGTLVGRVPVLRNVRRLLANFRNAVSEGRCGDTAIFPAYRNCGKNGSRFRPEVEAEMLRLIKEKTNTPAHADPCIVRNLLVAKFCPDLPLTEIPTTRTIYRRIAEKDIYVRTKDTRGKRIALKHQPIFPKSNAAPPPQGQKSFDVAHVDCSKIDMAMVDGTKLIRASMVDGFDGRHLATVIWDGNPNGSLMRELILDCLERHGTLPTTIVFDWGTENNTLWMTASMAKIGIICTIRPKADPRKGASVEGGFSAECRQLFHNLDGNTELLKHARMVTQAVNPEAGAIWTMEELKELVEEYHQLRNDVPRGDRASPNAVAAECEARYGPHPQIGLGAEELRRALLPFATNIRRTVSPRGTIRCNKKDYYSHGLRAFIGKEVDVRCDENKPTEVYAQPPGTRRTIACQICGRGFDDHELLETAKRFDDVKVSPIRGVPYDEAKQAIFAAKTDATQQRLKIKKRKNAQNRQKSVAIPIPADAHAAAPVFKFENFNRV